MKLISLTLHNFQGVSDREILMDGNNVDVFGANGAGKTTNFDAFTWDLWGKDSKNNGYDVANSVAARKAQNYQAQRISTLSSQLGYQGLGSSGAVNNLGAQVLTKLLNESPDTYKALANMYAMPKDDYLFNNTIKQAVTNEGLQKDLSGYNSGLRMNESDHNLGNTIKLNDHNLGNQMRLKQFEVGLSVQQKAAMDQIALKTQGMSMQQKYGIMYNAAKQLYVSSFSR
ncbi:MAG: AAA family ATPase [Selenomonadaceae bacterium]